MIFNQQDRMAYVCLRGNAPQTNDDGLWQLKELEKDIEL